MKMEFEQLRGAGLSGQKSNYVQNVARFFHEESLSIADFVHLNDQEVIDMLTRIKGVGVWTVQMLMMFTLNRKDVFPAADLGIQNGMKHLYRLDSENKALIKELIQISNGWKPYRSIASKLIWKAKDAKE